VITTINFNAGDAITGERIFPGERAFDTGIPNVSNFSMSETLNRFVKEETIVWLAEQAGYTLVKRDAGDSGHAEGVDGEDASVGGGETAIGKAPAGGSKATKRRSSRTTKG
jgi:hypothetical protein